MQRDVDRQVIILGRLRGRNENVTALDGEVRVIGLPFGGEYPQVGGAPDHQFVGPFAVEVRHADIAVVAGLPRKSAGLGLEVLGLPVVGEELAAAGAVNQLDHPVVVEVRPEDTPE